MNYCPSDCARGEWFCFPYQMIEAREQKTRNGRVPNARKAILLYGAAGQPLCSVLGWSRGDMRCGDETRRHEHEIWKNVRK